MDDEFRAYHGRVWSNALEAAEGFAVKVFLPTGEQVTAVLVNDLVRLRRLPAIAAES
ncbi:hypothetical protein J2X63_003221 [Agromyces sp. 3263]|uniref:hypothetical protein n=1 Tax=Agromyces sp. 3263 TaxID=2817750 RepID=UPI0028589B63|nr:hypothetical protein [Agromyces sp. 3263]MDR6907513.1 hypothetical protein [Agromyces sp. 3263]